MRKIKLPIITIITLLLFFLVGCNGDSTPIFYGNFETEQLNIAAGGSGRIVKQFFFEGERCDSGETLFIIDTSLLVLGESKAMASIDALKSSIPDASSRLNIVEEKRAALEREAERVERLVRAGSVSEKMLEPIKDKLLLVDKEWEATSKELTNNERSLLAQIEATKAELAIIRERISNCYIIVPKKSTIVSLNVKEHEYIMEGMPIATLLIENKIYFNGWVGSDYLYSTTVGDSVTLYADRPNGAKAEYRGKIINVSERAQFIPSMVQTREKRAQQHYRVKVELNYDSALKEGMPAEMVLK